LVTRGSIEEHILRSADRKIKLDEKIRDNDERDDDTEWLDETVMEALRNELRKD
jgi:SNF2 family DNA or RNA helicase